MPQKRENLSFYFNQSLHLFLFFFFYLTTLYITHLYLLWQGGWRMLTSVYNAGHPKQVPEVQCNWTLKVRDEDGGVVFIHIDIMVSRTLQLWLNKALCLFSNPWWHTQVSLWFISTTWIECLFFKIRSLLLFFPGLKKEKREKYQGSSPYRVYILVLERLLYGRM